MLKRLNAHFPPFKHTYRADKKSRPKQLPTQLFIWIASQVQKTTETWPYVKDQLWDSWPNLVLEARMSYPPAHVFGLGGLWWDTGL